MNFWANPQIIEHISFYTFIWDVISSTQSMLGNPFRVEIQVARNITSMKTKISLKEDY